MLKSPLLFAVGVLVALIQWTTPVRAQEKSLGLSFDLPPVQQQSIAEEVPEKSLLESPSTEPAEQKSVVEIASASPSHSVSSESLTNNPEETDRFLQYEQEDLPPIALAADEVDVEPEEESIAGLDIGSGDSSDATPDVAVSDVAAPDIALSFSAHNIGENISETEPAEIEEEQARAESDNPALLFLESTLDNTIASVSQSAPSQPPADVEKPAFSVSAAGLGDWIFDNGTESLVARTVGSAEGTRHWDGRKTRAYYGHVDPGNGVWNLGTFSYQHEAQDPEDADDRQLRRLQRQGIELEAQAARFGISLSLEEKLNGLDLANQAPLAALDKGGYIERLAQAHRLQMNGDEAILWARTHSYMDPDTRRWNAPGLGNNVHSISKDQERRIHAIAKAMTAFEPTGSNSVALDHLEEISLENAGIALNERSGDDAVSASKRAFSNIEVSFGLPPADRALIAAISTPVTVEATVEEPTVAEIAEEEAIADDVEASSVAIASEESSEETSNIAAQAPTTQPSAQSIGVDFLSSEDIAINDSNAEAASTTVELGGNDQLAITTEIGESELEEVGPEAVALEEPKRKIIEPEESTAEQAEPAEADATVTSLEQGDDLFSITEPDTDSIETGAAVATRTPEISTQPASRLQSLIDGIIPRNQPEGKPTTPAETAPEDDSSLWRTEDKIVDKK